MRGSDATSGSLFSYVDLEERVPAQHPLRTIQGIVNDVLASLDAEFERLYEGSGRQSIAPERLAGETLANMYAVTGDTSYRDRAVALGYMLLYELQFTPATDAYWWYYWPKDAVLPR